MEQDH